MSHCHASCCQGDCDPAPDCQAGEAHWAQMILDREGYGSGFFGEQHFAVQELLHALTPEDLDDLRVARGQLEGDD